MNLRLRNDLVRVCAVMTLAAWPGLAEEPALKNRIVFVAASGAEPYAQALEGFRSVFPNATPVILDHPDPLHTPALAAALSTPAVLVVVAGKDALEAVVRIRPDAPLLATMVLSADRQSRASWPPLAVVLDPEPSQIATEIAALFPNRHRIALLSNRGNAPQNAPTNMEAAYQRAGIETIECPSAGDLLPSFISLRNKADFALTIPDATLYNSTTVKPLIMASIEHHLPIIGFSESFVRSGAAVGVYPDYRDVGVQTAALAQKYLAGEIRKAHETPRTAVVAVNQRILRLMGLDYKQRPGLVIFR